MEKNEMRFLRREFISEYIPTARDVTNITLSEIKYYVRFLERVNYGYELQAYKMFP